MVLSIHCIQINHHHSKLKKKKKPIRITSELKNKNARDGKFEGLPEPNGDQD
jgi:hypothetical protein